MPLLRMDVKLEESVERMVSLASPSYYPAQLQENAPVGQHAITGTDGKLGSGAYALTWPGDSSYAAKRYTSLDKD